MFLAKLLSNYLTIHDAIMMVTSGQAALLNMAIAVTAIVYKDTQSLDSSDQNSNQDTKPKIQ